MAFEVQIERSAPAAVSPSGRCRAGWGRVDLTPHTGIAMAGYSTDGQRARGVSHRLGARVLALEGADGTRAALVVADLMSGSRYLWERVAALAAPRTGIAREHLVLCGTHTHTGPGHFYGNALYDHLAQCRSGFDPGLADWLSERMAAAVERAFQAARPARLGVKRPVLWGFGRNASPAAFAANPEAATWANPGQPGAGAPEHLTSEQRAVDPRVAVLVTVDDDSDALTGVLAIPCAHNTALGSGHLAYDPDWYGYARRSVERALGVPVAVAAGAGGDINVLQPAVPQGPRLARRVGEWLGAEVARAAKRAAERALPFEVEVRFGGIDRAERSVPGHPDTELADGFRFGVPALCGGEDARTVLYDTGLARVGWKRKRHDPADPHGAKATALGPLHDLYRRFKGLDVSPVLPLHVLHLGPVALCGVPFEPTVTSGWRIEGAVATALDVPRVAVLGYAGDYAGYLTTAEEYATQHYEGASTLLGCNQERHVRARLATLPIAAVSAGTAAFATLGPVRYFAPERVAGT